MSRQTNIFLFVLLTASLLTSSFSVAADCPAQFADVAASGPKGLTTAEINELKVMCQRDSAQLTQPDFIANLTKNSSPEFLRAIFYQCRSIHNLSLILNNSLNQQMNGYAAGGELWSKLASSKLALEDLPPRMVSSWKEDSLRVFQSKLQTLSVAHNRGTGYQYTELMSALLNAKPFLTAEEIKSTVRLLAESFSNTVAGPSGPLVGMFAPKAFQFAKQAVRRDLGFDYIPLTDLVPLRSGNSIFFKVVSVDPLEGEGITPRNAFGLHIAAGYSLQIPINAESNAVVANGSTLWKVGNKKYEAKYKVTVGQDVREIAPSLKTLDYEGMWADKKLTGIVFPGANMGHGEAGAQAVMENYQEYFTDKGFTFTAPKPVEDIREFLKEETVSGRLDYLIKEAHSDGSDRELVKLAAKGNIITGTKELKGGKQEVVHLFFPAEAGLVQGPPKAGLEFKSVGEWMKARTDAGGKQLFFVDTSCHGMRPACALASATNDKNLVAIGASDLVDTFTNDSTDTVYRLLNGIRAGKSFSAIKGTKRLQINVPGTKAWESGMHGGMRRTASTEVDLFEDGKKIDIEMMGEQ